MSEDQANVTSDNLKQESKPLTSASGNASANAEAFEPDKWARDSEYWLTSIGYMIGYGNIWRFPALMYNGGGWTFLIPYLFALFLIGIPLWLIESAFGQLIDCRMHARWGTLQPRLWGVAIAQTIVCFFMATYYVTLICWSFSFFFSSFGGTPWMIDGYNLAEKKEEMWNEKYFLDGVLEISETITSGQAQIVGPLCGFLALAYVLVYFTTFLGIKSIGKAVYITSTVPYLLLLIIFCNGLTLE